MRIYWVILVAITWQFSLSIYGSASSFDSLHQKLQNDEEISDHLQIYSRLRKEFCNDQNAKPQLEDFGLATISYGVFRHLYQQDGVDYKIAIRKLYPYKNKKWMRVSMEAQQGDYKQAFFSFELKYEKGCKTDAFIAYNSYGSVAFKYMKSSDINSDSEYIELAGGWKKIYYNPDPILGKFDSEKKRVMVGLIDSGVDYNHRKLVDNIDPSYIGYDTHDMLPYDFSESYLSAGAQLSLDGHGTHMAGTITKRNNDAQIIAVADNMVDLQTVADMHLKGVRIININFGTNFNSAFGGSSKSISDMASESFKHYQEIAVAFPDILFVIPAGNDGQDNDILPNYPSNYPQPNILAVASVNRFGKLSSFSNYGKSSVDIAALGERIRSATAQGGMGYMSGTCMAAGMVTRLASQILAVDPKLTSLQIIDIILSTAKKEKSLDGKIVANGVIDRRAALKKAADFKTE